jgi:hypothetical protein
MRAELVELSHSSCEELHWQVFFRGELAATLRTAFSKCPLLANEINLYRLTYVESPTELATVLGTSHPWSQTGRRSN